LSGPGADRARALALTPVSDSALARLDRYVALLLDWQSRINLIAPSTVPEIWTRHVADSLQLLDLAPDARIWVDFGSGGGFPGLAVACVLADRPGAQVHLVESNGKKAAFLREAARVAGAPVTVHAVRIGNFGESFSGPVDVVSARALAPLKQLCDEAAPYIHRGVDRSTLGLFLKGQDVEVELTEAAKYWRIEAEKAPSRTSPDGRIVIVRGLEPR
jgi:16S rRNA (guanine527-N7)-methyltransferase